MLETGIGHEVSLKAVAKAYGQHTKDIRKLYKEHGDLGTVAQNLKSK